jgi:signal transduction histidine kinase
VSVFQRADRILEAFFEHSVQFGILMDTEGRVIRATDSLNRVLHKDTFDVQGHLLKDLLQGQGTLEFHQLNQKAIRDGQVYQNEEMIQVFGDEYQFWNTLRIPIKSDQNKVVGLLTLTDEITSIRRQEEALRTVIQNVGSLHGQNFLDEIVFQLQKAIGAEYVFIGELEPNLKSIKTIALNAKGEKVPNFSYDLAGTPCADVMDFQVCTHIQNVASLFPQDVLLAQMNIEGYIGTPLVDDDKKVFGILVALFQKPILKPQAAESLFSLFAGRITAELLRDKVAQELKRLNTELEDRVEQRTAQLQRLNKELETFAYTVSHDLKAPLRSIDGFSVALKEDFADCLTPEGLGYIQRIRHSAKDMNRLIEDLLSLSRVVRHELDFQKVDMQECAHQIISRLKESEPERLCEVIIEENLEIVGDKGLIQILLTNLIENSWKYSSKKSSTLIHLGRIFLNGSWVYFVRDQGVGFDKSQSQLLFTAFQRLHTKEEFDGSGIGLATCQRITQRHGGKIWAVSEGVNLGATVFFQW